MTRRRAPLDWGRVALRAATSLPDFASPLGALTLQSVIRGALDHSHLGELLTRLANERVGNRPDLKTWLARADRVLPRRGLFRTTCLYRNMARFALLHAAGDDARLVIGVATRGGDLRAHAWLELGGRPHGRDAGHRHAFAEIFAHPTRAGTPETHCGLAGHRINSDVHFAELPDESGVLLHLGTKMYYLLNRTGALAWQQLTQTAETTPADLAARLAADHPDTDPSAIDNDVAALLDTLRAEGLIEREAR